MSDALEKDEPARALHSPGAPLAGDRGGPVIATRRLVLRPPRHCDAQAIVRLADNPQVARNLVGMPHPYRLEHAVDWIAEGSPDGGQKHLIWMKLPDGQAEPIGAATLDFRRGAKLPTLGAWFGEAYWHKGFATEACQAVIDYAFLHQGHQKLSFSCRVTNEAGRRVIGKCGFQQVAQELESSAFAGSVVAVDRFQLDRGIWASLRGWAPLRFEDRAEASGSLAL